MKTLHVFDAGIGAGPRRVFGGSQLLRVIVLLARFYSSRVYGVARIVWVFFDLEYSGHGINVTSVALLMLWLREFVLHRAQDLNYASGDT